MSNKVRNFLRGLLVVVPLAFLSVSIISNSNCTGVDGTCEGSATTTDADACAAYAAANGCDVFDFLDGTCTVTGCEGCEIIVDDIDPVIDVDDGGFIF